MENNEIIKEIRSRYEDYVFAEFGDSDIDENSTILDLMYTSVGLNEEYDLQVSYDLENQQMITTLSQGVLHENGKTELTLFTYKESQSLESFCEELDCVDFNGYYSYAHDIVEDKFHMENIDF